MFRRSFIWIFLAILAAIVLSQSCGKKSKDSNNSTPPLYNGDAVIPSDWDGKSDWTGSSWEALDQ